MTTTTDTAPSTPTPAPRKKSSLLKIILKLFTLLILLIIVGIVTLYFARNSLVRAGVVRGSHTATGLNTDLETADLALFDGALNLSQLDIHNLDGYKEPKMITMKSCDVTVLPKSFFSDTLVIDTIAISGLEITLEQNGPKSNFSELVENLKNKTAAAGNAANAPPGKKLKINKIEMASTKVHIRANPFNLDLDLGPIHMDDPTNPDGRPMKIADLVGKILMHVAQQLIDNPMLPGELRDSMKNVTALVDNLRKDLDKDLKNLTNIKDIKDLQNIGQSLGKDAGKDLKDAGKGLQDATKGIQNLLKQKKDPPK